MINHDVLEQLLFFLSANRRNGTTTTLVRALEETPNALLVVSNHQIKKDISKNYNITQHRIITLANFEKLRGINLHSPIIFDSDVIIELINMLTKDKSKTTYHDDPQLVYDEYMNKTTTGIYFSDDGLRLYTTTSDGQLYSIETQIPFDVSTTVWSSIRFLGSQKYEIADIPKFN